ncbi:MAG TPA: delta-60 repeat domain-containing protein, partial [Gemmatimonadales bacterium]|nr:delta-60 repeat domain-containing protein [Gemmatimonadales bacterium]
MSVARSLAMLGAASCALASPLGAQGMLDTTFGDAGRLVIPFSPTTHDRLEAIAALPDGRFIGAGWIEMAGGDLHTLVVRFRPDGRIDSTF